MGAHLLEAAPLVAVDVSADKLQLARQLGATDVVDASRVPEEEVASAVHELTHGGAEFTVEAVGMPSTLKLAFEALKPGGVAIAVGLSSVKAEASVPINALVQQQKHLVGSLYGSSNPAM